MRRNCGRRSIVSFVAAVVLLGISGSVRGEGSAGKPAAPAKGTAGGLLVDAKDDGLIVQIDNEQEPTKFLYDGAITKDAILKRGIFNVDRVNLKYKADGDDRKLTAVEKVPGRATGVVVGQVIKVYNNFWVAVKPNGGGMIEGFALNWPPEKFKQSHELIKTLQPGDTVSLKYASDFERHRILDMQLKPTKP
ncbi:MAG TPA: hypothetical protein VLJ39_13780, partial [Tepidisphaeraceae bacterium]|nr:hypothetical protein [Tepidisphaeraceae bacterium]